jgi:anti-sigma regulatory factor (Ser/Thr protein kinase)
MNDQIIAGGTYVPPGPESVHPLFQAAEFGGEPGSMAEARQLTLRFLQQLEAEWLAALAGSTRDDVLLVVSELVTNAERHSHGPYLLELEGTDRQVHVTVYDSSTTLPRRYERDPTRVGGHGMEVVHALCDRLVAEHVPVGKRVRATFDLQQRGTAV